MHAARNGHSSTVEKLIKYGADINLKNDIALQYRRTTFSIALPKDLLLVADNLRSDLTMEKMILRYCGSEVMCLAVASGSCRTVKQSLDQN
ncbi:hypothetical protein L9F63_023724, partial [Diploptera punctata]